MPALLITTMVVVTTQPMLSWPYQEWIRTSAEFHQQNALTAPIAAAAATYFAGRLTPPNRIFALPSAVRVGGAMVARHLLLLGASFIIAYLAGLIPLVLATVRSAQHGYPAPAVIVSGLLGLCAAVCVGYLIGVIGRTAFLAPLSFVLMVAVSVAGYGGDTYSALIPVLHVTPSLGMREAIPFVTYRIAFFITVIVVGYAVAARLLDQHREHTRLPPFRSVVLLGIPILLTVPPLIKTPVLFESEADPPRICATRNSVEYCLHAGHRTELSVMVATADEMLATYGTPTPRAARVWDSALRGTRSADPSVIWYGLEPDDPSTSSIVSVAWALSGYQACVERYGDEAATTSEAASAFAVAEALNAWLLHKGAPPKGYPLYGVPVDVVQRWIALQDARIATCSLRAEDLPS